MQDEKTLPASSSKIADRDRQITLKAVLPAPKLKIRLSGLGNKGKEREVESVSTPAPLAVTSATTGNIAATGNESGSRSWAGLGNGCHANVPQQQVEKVQVDDSEEEREVEERKRFAVEQLKAEERRIQDEKERIQHDLLELPAIAKQYLVPFTEIARRLVARSFSELQSLVET